MTALAHPPKNVLDFHPDGIYRNLAPAALYEHAIRRGEAMVADGGPLVATTGEHTGRSPKDRFIVRRDNDEKGRLAIDWGAVNQPCTAEAFDCMFEKVQEFVAGREMYSFEGYAGADPASRIKVRVLTEYAWHSLFAHNMFLREDDPAKLVDFEPDFTVIDTPSVRADHEALGLNSPTYVLVDLDRHLVLIGGTEYAGEIKKSIFGVMNWRLPHGDVLSMHCSANYGESRDDVALFFGLSGTGKTTLSSAPNRTLIGDDEHGWNDEGVFNIEGGCYAKVIRLDPEAEPAIYETTRTFGTVLENVVADLDTRKLDLNDDRYTENTRSSYPLTHLENVDLGGVAGHPRQVIFLTCDAFGVLPPVSVLDESQAMYHFLSGYTAKVAGTERGVTEPQATFSACFGAPFMPLAPGVYAKLLGEKVKAHNAAVYLINTGWTAGPHGTGHRISLAATRRIVEAALSGELVGAETRRHPIFGLAMPTAIAGVDSNLLDPRRTWADPAQYDEHAGQLAGMFRDNFRQFEGTVADTVTAAGPV